MPRLARRSEAQRQLPFDEGPSDADRAELDRQTMGPSSGEGSESALARLRNIERARQQSQPDR